VLRWLFACVAGFAHAADPLPALQADAGALTVSGVSSGGFMAIQVHVAHSARVRGAGALAAGPYYCAQGSFWTARNNCMTPGAWTPLPSTAFLAAETQSLARLQRIDATSHLAGAKVWLFGGASDRTVAPEVVAAAARFYEGFKANVAIVRDKAAGHGMVTENAGNACEATEPPFINDCDYDAAGALLGHLLGTLAAPGSNDGRVVAFDQKPFGAGLADLGFLYVPRACEPGGCRVHVAFHGCRQNAEAVGERFVREAGYNRWADTNRLVVLYPQARASAWPFNPRACWDWWGYTGPAYHTQQAPQIRAVMAMVGRLSARK
jgi:poly(3-hydroxybutyrate) depolymerase